METPVLETINGCASDSYAGNKSFGEIVGILGGAGVESYFADYRSGSTSYYLPDGSAHVLPLRRPALAIPPCFDAGALLEAIRGAQRGEVKYPQFLALSMAAGCVGYAVWLAGRHVAYFGRKGEVHIEHFPPQ